MLRRFAWMLMPLAYAWAGGFFLTVHGPAAAGSAKDAVLTVDAQGCQDYSHARITGQAEGTIHGKRQSIALELAPLGKGSYAVRRQWPADGKWVLVFSGTSGERHTHTIVEFGPDGELRPHASMGAFAPVEVEAMLR